MAKDYAKKSKKTKVASRGSSNKKRSTTSRENNTSSAGLMIVSILIVISIAGFFFLKERHIQELKHKMLTALQTKPKKEITVLNKPAEPQYDFYTILPREKVWVPKGDDNTNATTTTPSKEPPAPMAYIVQVAAFEQYAPADDLKAQLILEGYSVHVDPKPVNGWTRVWLGPFKTLQDAQNTQVKVAESNKLKGMIEPISVS